MKTCNCSWYVEHTDNDAGVVRFYGPFTKAVAAKKMKQLNRVPGHSAGILSEEYAMRTGVIPRPPEKPYDVAGAIIRYECEELPNDEVLDLFRHLVKTGMAWSLQGSYGAHSERADRRRFDMIL